MMGLMRILSCDTLKLCFVVVLFLSNSCIQKQLGLGLFGFEFTPHIYLYLSIAIYIYLYIFIYYKPASFLIINRTVCLKKKKEQTSRPHRSTSRVRFE